MVSVGFDCFNWGKGDCSGGLPVMNRVMDLYVMFNSELDLVFEDEAMLASVESSLSIKFLWENEFRVLG